MVKCDSNVDVLSAQTNSTIEVIKTTNTTIPKTYPNPDPIVNFLMELQNPDSKDNLSMELRNLVNILNQINQRTSSVQQKSGGSVSNKQIAGFPELPPFIETLRKYFKMAYKSYLMFQPEVKFGQCITKYFYMRFPAAMRFFQMQNLSKYIRRMYSVSGIMTNNIITRTIFTWFDDTELDRERIAIKMATITNGPMTPFQRSVKPILEFYENITQSTQIYPNLLQLPVIAGPILVQRRRRRFQRDMKYPENFQIHYKNNMKSEQNSNRVKKSSDSVDTERDGTIDLTNKSVEREAEELFNIDTMFWKSLGFEEDSFKKYSLAYCTRAYVTDSFSRFMKNIVLA